MTFEALIRQAADALVDLHLRIARRGVPPTSRVPTLPVGEALAPDIVLGPGWAWYLAQPVGPVWLDCGVCAAASRVLGLGVALRRHPDRPRAEDVEERIASAAMREAWARRGVALCADLHERCDASPRSFALGGDCPAEADSPSTQLAGEIRAEQARLLAALERA